MKQAMIFYGGWDGHEPKLVSARFAKMLEAEGFGVRVHDSMDCLGDYEALKKLDLIVSCWTMDELDKDHCWNIAHAVGSGVGLAGCHGGMCDSFRQSVEWQFMTGGQWVSHPGGDGIEYTVNITSQSNPITQGREDFPVTSEHYYLHIDPAVEVLATTRFPSVSYFHISNKPVDMPVAWTKMWGLGRVFYNSLGHQDNVFDASPNAATLMRRGMLWASGGKAFAEENGLTSERFENTAKMY